MKENGNVGLENTQKQHREEIAKYVDSCKEHGFLAFDAFELKEKYPKAFLSLEKSLSEHILQDGVQKSNEEVFNYIVNLLIFSARIVLYPFFDSSELYINIVGQKEDWNGSINSAFHLEKHSTRVKAEYFFFEKAFEMLNNKREKEVLLLNDTNL